MLVQNVPGLDFIGLPPGKTFSFDARSPQERPLALMLGSRRRREAPHESARNGELEFHGNHWKSGNFQFSTLRYFESISNCVSSIYCLCWWLRDLENVVPSWGRSRCPKNWQSLKCTEGAQYSDPLGFHRTGHELIWTCHRDGFWISVPHIGDDDPSFMVSSWVY
jgi:hypothetical protein